MVETNVILTTGLNQRVGANNIGLNKWVGILQRIVIMAFGCVVNYGISLRNQLIDQFLVTDIANYQFHTISWQSC